MTTQSLTLRYPMAKTQSFNFTVAMTPDISAKVYIIFEITLDCESEAQLGLEWCHKKGQNLVTLSLFHAEMYGLSINTI